MTRGATFGLATALACLTAIPAAPRSNTKLSSHPEGEASVTAVAGGQLLEEVTVSTQEIDVIILTRDEPLIRRRGQSDAAKLHRALARLQDDIVRLDNASRKARSLPERARREIIRREYTHLLSGVAARLRAETLEKVRVLPDVARVWRDRKAHTTLAQSVPLIQADRVWNELGASGLGITVAIVDTGIDYTHPDLGGCLGPSCKVIGGYDFVNDDADPMDDFGHGTHVAGIVSANGAVKGVAPGSVLLGYKVLDSSGSGLFSDVIAGVEQAAVDGARVINLSLGGPGDPNDPVCQAVDNAVAGGIVVAVAAGNSGPGYETLGSPGMARLALTVGASDKNDLIAQFSSRGPAPQTYQMKPDITAPGAGILSTVPDGACPLCSETRYLALNGTSMATPHAAGAAALLLERFPSWSPEQVREALAERAVDLGENHVTQGSGRIDAFAAATPAALISPASLSFGLDDLTQPLFARSADLTLTNMTAAPATWSFSVQGAFPPGLTATVTPTTLELNPAAAGVVTFDLAVNNATVPNVTTPPFAYEGRIVAQAAGQTLAVPFSMIKSPALEVVLDGEEPWTLTVHDRAGWFRWLPFPGPARTFLLPAGLYDLEALYLYGDTWVVREGVGVTTKSTVHVTRAEADHPLTIVPTDIAGQPIPYVRPVTKDVLLHKDSGVAMLVANAFPPSQRMFSTLSNEYLFETTRMENLNPPAGPVYTFHGYARDGVDGPITFTNTPSDFKHLTLRYTPDPGVSQIMPLVFLNWVAPAIASGDALCGSADPPLTAPFEVEEYLMPPPYPEFSVGYMRTMVNRNPAAPCAFAPADLMHVTPWTTPRNTTTFDGFIWNEMSVPVFTTTAGQVTTGLGPDSWFGRFENHSSEIRVGPVLGPSLWLWLDQTRNVRPHNPLPYQLYQAGSLVQAGELNAGGLFSFVPTWETIAVAPGAYSLVVPFGGFHLGGLPALATMTAALDTRNADPNPPFLSSLTLSAGGTLTDLVPSSGAQLRMKLADDVGLRKVSVFSESAGTWLELPVSEEPSGEMTATLPGNGSAPTFVPFTMIAEDLSGNRLTLAYCAPGAGTAEICDGFDNDCDSLADEGPDPDGDGVAVCDCAPADPGSFGLPPEVSDLVLAADGAGLTWTPAAGVSGPGTVYDLARGSLHELPAGSGASEVCLASGIPSPSSGDIATPAPGSGFWYLVRARNACGAGRYGVRSNGSETTLAVCQ